METTRKNIIRLIVGCLFAAYLSTFIPPAFAIEGLQISVASTNAVLAWPSDPSETYLIQYRNTLNATDSWTTLTDYYPADYSSNLTFFIDPSPIQLGSVTGGDSSDTNDVGGGGIPVPGGTNFISGTNGAIVAPGTGFYRVVRDGAYLYVTNGTLWTDLVTVPVELGNAYGVANTMSLTENGDMVGDSIQPGGTTLTVDTTQMSNGVHEVSVSTSWADTNGNYTEADSPPVSVIVSNEISYSDWMPAYGELGNSVVFQAVSAHTNADWQIDVYGSDYYYIGSFTGTTTDGNMQVVWNLVDPYGSVRTNDAFFICEITTWYDTDSGTGFVHPLVAASSSSVTPKTYKQNDPWLGPGKFAIAMEHAFDFITDHETLYDELEGFTGAANGTFGVLPSQSGDVPYAIPFRDDNGNNGDPVAGWAAFRSALYDPHVRNLVYFGHGGATGLGYNSSNTNVFITADEVAKVLYTIPAGQTNIHRFRFVFVDGCSTASGKMPEAFGIIHKENVPGIDYSNASLRPSCYCGWIKDKSVGFLAGAAVNYDHVNFIANIQTEMLANNHTIGDAVSIAASEVSSGFMTTSDFKIYGYRDLSFGAFNN